MVQDRIRKSLQRDKIEETVLRDTPQRMRRGSGRAKWDMMGRYDTRWVTMVRLKWKNAKGGTRSK